MPPASIVVTLRRFSDFPSSYRDHASVGACAEKKKAALAAVGGGACRGVARRVLADSPMPRVGGYLSVARCSSHRPKAAGRCPRPNAPTASSGAATGGCRPRCSDSCRRASPQRCPARERGAVSPRDLRCNGSRRGPLPSRARRIRAGVVCAAIH